MENTNVKSLLEVAGILPTYKSNVKPSLRPKVTASKDAYKIFVENWHSTRIELVEQFKIVDTPQSSKSFGNFLKYQLEAAQEQLLNHSGFPQVLKIFSTMINTWIFS